MASRKKKALSQDDRRLWQLVAESTEPLPEAARNLNSEFSALMESTASAAPALPPQFGSPPKPAKALKGPLVQPDPPKPALRPHHPIEKTTLKKLQRGRQSVDGRLDLHGMTQDRARAELLHFLQHSISRGRRIVLVITGKGAVGQGVLKRRVPDWLATAPFAALVNGFEPAAPRHGGEGALYIRLRRNRSAQP